MPAWNEIMTHLRQLSASMTTQTMTTILKDCFACLDSDVHSTMVTTDWSAVKALYSPHILRPWWRLSCSGRLGLRCGIATLIHRLCRAAIRICEVGTIMMKACCGEAAPELEDRDLASGIVSIRTVDVTSPCLMPNRLVHKFMTLALWLVRAMDVPWLTKTFSTPADVSSDEFGMLPLTIVKPRPDTPEYMVGCDYLLAYMQHVDPVTEQRTLIPLTGIGYLPLSSSNYCLLENHLGSRMLAMVTRGGLPVRERGLYTFRNTVAGVRELDAATGWTGRLSDSFVASPVHVDYLEDEQLLDRLKGAEKRTDDNRKNLEKVVRAELAARAQPGYFHLVPAIKHLVGPTVWAAHKNDVLFIATPQLGLESEMVELALLESLAEEAEEAACVIDLSASGDQPSQLLIAHIEAECGVPIAEVIERQKSRVEWMMEAQADQLRIHAKAVERANNRGKLAAADSSSSDAAAASSGSSSTSALVPASTASSSSSSSSAASAVVPLSASGSSSVALPPAPAGSWTSLELQSLAALCTRWPRPVQDDHCGCSALPAHAQARPRQSQRRLSYGLSLRVRPARHTRAIGRRRWHCEQACSDEALSNHARGCHATDGGDEGYDHRDRIMIAAHRPCPRLSPCPHPLLPYARCCPSPSPRSLSRPTRSVSNSIYICLVFVSLQSPDLFPLLPRCSALLLLLRRDESVSFDRRDDGRRGVPRALEE